MRGQRLISTLFVLVCITTLGFSQRVGGGIRETVEVSANKRVVPKKSWLNHPIVKKALKHYVSIRIESKEEGGGDCTGILWQTGLILTNFHAIVMLDKEEEQAEMVNPQVLIDADEKISVDMQAQKPMLTDLRLSVNGNRARIVFGDNKKDLLLLAVWTKAVNNVTTRNTIEVEEPVFSIGDPIDHQRFVSGGGIVAIKNGLIKTTTCSDFGISGSGVYSAIDGKLIGIQVSGYDKKYRLAVARDINEIKEFLKEAQKKTKIKILM